MNEHIYNERKENRNKQDVTTDMVEVSAYHYEYHYVIDLRVISRDGEGYQNIKVFSVYSDETNTSIIRKAIQMFDTAMELHQFGIDLK